MEPQNLPNINALSYRKEEKESIESKHTFFPLYFILITTLQNTIAFWPAIKQQIFAKNSNS